MTSMSTFKPDKGNSWYCLATLYGEQSDSAINEQLAERNRIAWNRWQAEILDEKKRSILLNYGFSEHELKPFDETEKKQFKKDFASRINAIPTLSLPEPREVVDFSNVRFARRVSISKYYFLGVVDFSSTNFNQVADLQGTHFFDSVKFSKANFQSTSNFDSAHFQSTANFDSAHFQSTANFDSVRFAERANFLNTKFDNITIFAKARFESKVPDFRGAKLHEATEWHEVIWPYILPNPEGYWQQVYAYERLKQEMERLKKHEDEQAFFRMELRARLGLLPAWSIARWLNCSYRALSDYGYSIARPLLWMFGTFAFGALVFWLGSADKNSLMELAKAVKFSFSSLFSIFPISGKVMTTEEFTCLSAFAKIVVVAQSIFGALLFFLLGLSLRNRFRMK